MALGESLAGVEDTDRDFEIGVLSERYIHDADIVLVEGYKGNPYPKVEVHRSELKREILSSRKDNLIAVASDVPLQINVPVIDIDDFRKLVDLIEARFLKR